MKKFFIYAIFFICFLVGCFKENTIQTDINSIEQYNNTMKIDILCMMLSYPEHIIDLEISQNNEVYLVFKSGNKILYDDKKNKNYNQKFQKADIEDTLSQIYPLENLKKLPIDNYDPGRFRNYALFREVYGSSKEKMELNLTNVYGYQFNKNNNATKSLKSVLEEINSTIDGKTKYSFVYPISGTYNYRFISGTNMLSPHSFGIAIDLKYHKYDYWKWANKEQGETRLKNYPDQIVKIFEKNGFIWGGKWSHFDILHFEYRPEIVLKAKYFTLDEEWYKKFPQDENTKKCIKVIEEKF